MQKIRTFVVAALLAVWCFPAISSAAPNRNEGRLPAAVTETSAQKTEAPAQQAAASTEAQTLAQREQQTPDLKDFKGGAVYVYAGSTVLLVTLIVLLILII
jgi:hypothetical protein